MLLKPVTFVGGKGGVGKTTVAAAAALAAADSGLSTLLVSTDPAHSTGDILETPLADTAKRVADRLDALEIDPRAEADRYIAEVKTRIREVASPRLLAEVEREIDVARASPGAEEAALFDRFARILASDEHERIIFDTAPTGHTLRLLALPEQMQAWIDGLVSRRRKLNSLGRMWRNVAGAAAGRASPGQGRTPPDVEDPVLAALALRQDRFRAAREVVTDPGRSAFVFVVIPERLPILETGRAVAALRRYRIPVGGLVVNRVLPADADGDFLARRRDREAAYLAEIDARFGDLPRHLLTLRASDVVGVAALREVAAELAL